MVNKLPSDILKVLNLRNLDGLPKHLKISENNLLFKEEREQHKSAKEYLATKYARFLLPENLRVPEIWGVFSNCFVLKYYNNANQLNKNSKEEIYKAVNYLIEMHYIRFTNELKDILIKNHYCHYYGEPLKNRLSQELEFSTKAFDQIECMKKYLGLMEQIINICLKTMNTHPVLGHGDFQAKNILLVENNILPIDWVDFGVCERSYEIHHFINSLNPEWTFNSKVSDPNI